MVNGHLTRKGLLLERGTIVDAPIIAAPSSTERASGTRDPKVRQTKKRKQWYVGMKAIIGVDVESGPVDTVRTTSANEADVAQVGDSLHGEETVEHADAGYTGAEQRVEGRELARHMAEKCGR